MNIAVFCVTYNSNCELDNYLRSLINSSIKVADRITLDIMVADNALVYNPITLSETEVLSHINLSYYHFPHNPGYFGAVRELMSKTDISKYDYIIISNVDVTVDNGFFNTLLSKKYDEKTGWIATSILSQTEGRDRNPAVLKRYSKAKLRFLSLKHRIPLLNVLYNKTLYKRKKYKSQYSAMPIYAGHGSFILLSHNYFSHCGIIDYPMFLFCEELYLAEMCHKSGLTVYYDPSMIVYDKEHISIGKMKRGLSYRKSLFYKSNYQSLKYIIETFYKNQ